MDGRSSRQAFARNRPPGEPNWRFHGPDRRTGEAALNQLARGAEALAKTLAKHAGSLLRNPSPNQATSTRRRPITPEEPRASQHFDRRVKP